MIKCGECGYENMDGLDYCDGCGAKLAAAAGGTAAAPAENKSETTLPEAGADIDAKATPSLAADAPVDGQPTSEVPTGDLKKETPETPAPSADVSAGAAPSAAPSAFKAKLSVVRGGRKGQELPLEGRNDLVGP